jgi:hypothetical protein
MVQSSAIELLNGLQEYLSLLAAIRDNGIKNLQTSGYPPMEFRNTVSLSYSFIKIRLDHADQGRRASTLYLECTFQVEGAKVSITEIYCSDKTREQPIRDLIQLRSPFTWSSDPKHNTYNEETLGYLAIADEIAEQGYLCTSGDNYFPGFFSEITIEDSGITLKQINRMNSKSLDHRNDYSMRDLEFFIPLNLNGGNPFEAESRIRTGNDYSIGKMLVNFSDRSSENKKACGNRIREKILEKMKN